MKKNTTFTDIFVLFIITLVLIILQITLSSINNYLFVLTFVIFYLFILLSPSSAMLIFLFFASLIIDSIYNITIGSSAFIIFSYSILIHLQNKYLKTTNFIFSYLFFLLSSLILGVVVTLTNLDFLNTNIYNIIIFLMSLVLYYPIVYGIMILFYVRLN
jgi:hypothetical protein